MRKNSQFMNFIINLLSNMLTLDLSQNSFFLKVSQKTYKKELRHHLFTIIRNKNL